MNKPDTKAIKEALRRPVRYLTDIDSELSLIPVVRGQAKQIDELCDYIDGLPNDVEADEQVRKEFDLFIQGGISLKDLENKVAAIASRADDKVTLGQVREFVESDVNGDGLLTLRQILDFIDNGPKKTYTAEEIVRLRLSEFPCSVSDEKAFAERLTEDLRKAGHLK